MDISISLTWQCSRKIQNYNLRKREKKETEYATSQDTQYIILDGNFVNTSVTWERFQEHFAREKNTFYYFIENDGVITQIWEPYIP